MLARRRETSAEQKRVMFKEKRGKKGVRNYNYKGITVHRNI